MLRHAELQNPDSRGAIVKSGIIFVASLGVALSVAGARGKTSAKPPDEKLTILWPASALLLAGQQSKAPTLTAVKDSFGLEAWRSVQIPADPGAALTWNTDLKHPGDYDVYVEFQVMASDPNGHPEVRPLGFRLEAEGAVLQTKLCRTDYAHVVYPYEYPSSQYL